MAMQTRVDEIAPQIYRFSTFRPESGIVFNQFLIDADEPLLFHTGQKWLFPQLREAMARVMDPTRLRWITFGHYEADECGAMNDWLRVAPQATIAHGTIGCRTQNAVDQGRAVAARLMGKPKPYNELAWFWSDQGDLKLMIAGLAHGVDQWVVRGDPAMRRSDLRVSRWQTRGGGIGQRRRRSRRRQTHHRHDKDADAGRSGRSGVRFAGLSKTVALGGAATTRAAPYVILRDGPS